MARLPDYEPNTPLDTNVSGIRQVTAEQKRFFATVSEGLTVMGQEMVKTEAQRAASNLSAKLNDIEQEIAANPQVSTQYLRDKLGPDFDTIPPEVKSNLTQKTLDLKAGQLVDEDRNDIPMWQVAGTLYDRLSQRAVSEASQGITMPGWKTDFRDNMANEVNNRRDKINTRQLQAMHADLGAKQTETALQFANAGDFGSAFQVVRDSRVMDPEYKTKVEGEIAKVQDTKPIFDAIRTDDYGSMAELVGQLNDPSKFTNLTAQERQQFSERLKGEIRQFSDAAAKAEVKQKKDYDDSVAKMVYTAKQQGLPLSYKMIPPDVSAEAQKSLMAYVDADRKQEPIKTNYPLYAALYEAIKKGKPVVLTEYLDQLSGPDFKQLLEAQVSKDAAPVKFDQFVTTDEEINSQLRQIPGIDPSAVKDEKMMGKVGYLKSIIQRDLMDSQLAKAGQAPLDPQERAAVIANTLKREVDPKKGFFSSTSIPALKAGVPARMVPDFRRAVAALGFKNPGSEETLASAYADYQANEPGIELAWQQIRGTNILPSQAVAAWYYLNANRPRLLGRLQATGGATQDRNLQLRRLAALAVQEMSQNTAR